MGSTFRRHPHLYIRLIYICILLDPQHPPPQNLQYGTHGALKSPILTGLVIFIPIILNNSALGHTAEETSSTDAAAGALGACVPSAQQVTVIKAMVTSETANCTFANVTIGAIVGMQ